MHSLSLFLLSFIGLAQSQPSSDSSLARSLPNVDDTAPLGTLHVPHRRDSNDDVLPFKRTLPVVDDVPGTWTLPVVHAAKRGLLGRSLEVQLENRSDVAYYAQLQIGTPPQSVYAQLDTGSFELWVNPDCSGLSGSNAQFCNAIGQYSPKDSSSSKTTSANKEVNYGVGSVKFDYVLDDVSLSDNFTIQQLRFGVATETKDQSAGVLGLGHGKGYNTDYPNFLDQLTEQKLTKTKTFSIALGSKADDGGVIVFGGVDTSKFTGKLGSLPIINASNAPDKMSRYWVQMDSVSHTPPEGKEKTFDNSSLPIFLDTGATLTLLPESIVKSVANDLKSTGLDKEGFYTVDCGLVDKDGTVNFKFNGVTVKVPYKEIIREFSDSCYLGITSSDEYALLGDTFMRSAYAVFDLDSETIFLAQYDDCGSTVREITASKDIGSIKGSCGDSSSAKDVNENSTTDGQDSDNDKETKSSSTTASGNGSSSSEAATADATAMTSAAASATSSGGDATATATHDNGATGLLVGMPGLLGVSVAYMMALAMI